MRLHVLVDELETARLAVAGGATVVQWRLKDVPRVDVVERGRATRSLCARHGVPFIVNDDVEAALMLGADGVHLGRADHGAETAKEHGLMLGLSASTLEEARAADGRGDYIGAGPVWETPSKPDADPPLASLYRISSRYTDSGLSANVRYRKRVSLPFRSENRSGNQANTRSPSAMRAMLPFDHVPKYWWPPSGRSTTQRLSDRKYR